MGRGKVTSIVGEYDFYSDDYNEFAIDLAFCFGVNLDIKQETTTMTRNEEEFAVEDMHLHCNYPKTYRLWVNTYVAADGSKEVYYNLEVPIVLNHKEVLDWRFNPNGLCDAYTFNFDRVEIWQHFIGDVIMNLQGAKQDAAYKAKVKKTRLCYRELYGLVGCKKVLIQTDGYYKTETFGFGEGSKQSLDSYIKALSEVDKVRVLPIDDVLEGNIKIKEQNEYFDLALVDDFERAL